jgi:hypothetical protein
MMNTLSFEFLDKARFSEYAPRLFDILYSNMSIIAPSGNSREEDEGTWYNAVSGGLKRDARQIVLIRDAESTVGFFQYYINPRTFMMEEVQLLPEYQGRGALREVYRFLLPYIPDEIPSVEAFSDLRNARSMDILLKMGLMPVSEESGLCHFCGTVDGLKKWLNK